ncbi:Hpt domain-containing protein [Methylobacterium nonmethylotrophicum]|uniref:Hpt domain-containing protein n=1 Tax=Methylobacterium nonmethylotrophicum TaxID=1141884 RepID=A0A4Z0NE80_9HYPH|nr:Hpt domain-containing protein [Methylobacterium nonmethylotrophicum]TGD94291.1 Hpt domain-containing protein [Methylobacterium nonmethylotrophicum]
METTPPSFDAATYADLREAVGDAALPVLLGRFRIQLRDWAMTGEPAELGAAAHGVIASSGLIGFVRLSRLCAALETACQGGDLDAVRTLAAAVADEKAAAEAEIPRLIAAG